MSKIRCTRLGGRYLARGAEAAQVHEHRAVAVYHHYRLLRQAEGKAQPDGGGQSHGVLQVEEALPVSQGVQLHRHGAHVGDHDAVFEQRIDGLQRLDALHHSSHISSRVIRSATGLRELSASVWAPPMSLASLDGSPSLR